ncbi:MAG: hypothetical protein QXK12_07395 [Candidatus Nezhaarchaeales archaeon]
MTSLISIKEFEKIDLRVVRVVKAESIPGMRKILKVTVDIGKGELREIIAGGAEIYSPEYFVGKNFVAIVNLEPKRIAGITSEGMLLAADLQGKPVWITVSEDVPPGTKVR